MDELYEFRVNEEFAHRLFPANEGERLGSGLVRKVTLRADDPRLATVGQLQNELNKTVNRAFFYGWQIHRRYSRSELASAALFSLQFSAVFEPAGEECGTLYDEASACDDCGAGATLLPPLILDTRRIPRAKDFATTIAGEIIASRRVVDIFRDQEVTGVRFSPVRSRGPALLESSEWFYLQLTSHDADICPPTVIADGPFGDGLAERPCRRGVLAGLNLISEISVSAASRGREDIVGTRQFVGTRRGLLRPQRLVLMAPSVHSLLIKNKVRGWKSDVAYVR